MDQYAQKPEDVLDYVWEAFKFLAILYTIQVTAQHDVTLCSCGGLMREECMFTTIMREDVFKLLSSQ